MRKGTALFALIAIVMLSSWGCEPSTSQQVAPPLDGVGDAADSSVGNAGAGEPEIEDGIVALESEETEPADWQTALTEVVEIGPANARIDFVGTKKDGSHAGGFKEFTGRVHYDPQNRAIAGIEVQIQTDSLWSDNGKLTGHLKSPDFFTVRDHPEARFVSKQVTPADDGTHSVTGELTLVGETREIHFPIEASIESGGALKLASNFTIDRTLFGMTYGEGDINPEVEISVKVGEPTEADAGNN